MSTPEDARQDSGLGTSKGDEGGARRRADGPLDGSVSGTIGGGGAETGGSTERPAPPEMPPVNPENAASGRLEPDPLAAAREPDDLGPGPSDVSEK